jgi:RimJ/RimL family protein N-acetyltransferase
VTPYLVGRCLYGADDAVCALVSNLCGEEIEGTTIGVVSEGRLAGGVVYSEFRGHDIKANIAATSPKWLSRDVLRQLFEYPFKALGCARITVLVGDDNPRSERLARWLGFVPEGRLRAGMGTGRDGLVFGMLRRECRWIED